MRVNRGYIAIESCLKPLVQKTLSRQDKLLAEVVSIWDRVMADFHFDAVPIRILSNRQQGNILLLQCSSANAMKLSYQQGVLLEKLGFYLGRQPFSSIQIRQYDEVAPISARPSPAIKTTRNQNVISNELIDLIEDDSLQAALKRLQQNL